MGSARLLVAIVLLASGLAAAGAAYVTLHDGASGATDVYGIDIVGPDGVSLFSGEVRVENATVLDVLLAATERAGLEVETEEYPGMGTYVRAIGGYRAYGMSGWTYEIWRGEEWIRGDRSAAYKAMEPGDALRWRWVDG